VAVMMSKARLIDNIRMKPYYKSSQKERRDLISKRDEQLVPEILNYDSAVRHSHIQDYVFRLYAG
jgi:hypothetical protein